MKPYELVRVDNVYSYFGQVISYPDQDCVMVRRIPDDSASMVEEPLSRISKISCVQPMWVHYATIVGTIDPEELLALLVRDLAVPCLDYIGKASSEPDGRKAWSLGYWGSRLKLFNSLRIKGI